MTSNTDTQPELKEPAGNSQSGRPNEAGSFNVEGYVKIYDPSTNEIFLETRA